MRQLLRLRLWTSAGGVLLLLAALLPWLLLWPAWQAQGAWRAFLVIGLVAWGLVFLPLGWLGWKVLRLAWRPLPVLRPQPEVIEGERVDEER